jgi:hypothetical protein
MEVFELSLSLQTINICLLAEVMAKSIGLIRDPGVALSGSQTKMAVSHRACAHPSKILPSELKSGVVNLYSGGIAKEHRPIKSAMNLKNVSRLF